MTVSTHLWSNGSLGSRTQDGPPDEFGTPTWQISWTPILVAAMPRSSEEIAEAGGAGVTRWRAWYVPADGTDPAGLVAGAGDTIALGDGREFEVDGPARDWLNPRTKVTDFVEADVERVTR